MSLSYFEEAQETMNQNDAQVTLRCGCSIEIDPGLNEFARASIIRAHYTQHHPDQTHGRKF